MSNLIPPVLMLLLIIGSIWFLKKQYPDNKWIIWLENPSGIFVLLVIWVLIGFFTTVDYTQDWGCITFYEPVFSKANIFYSGTALIFITAGYFLSYPRTGTIILIAELIFWLYKLFLVKGGYVVGFGGGVSTEVLWFDTFALTLRLILIKQISQINLRTIFVLIPVIIIMSLKLLFFR